MTKLECPYKPTNGRKDANKQSMDIIKGGKSVQDWWPETLNLRILHQDPKSLRPSHIPHSPRFYEFTKLDLDSVRNDLWDLLSLSGNDGNNNNNKKNDEFWPADYGHYGPLMIRLAWHSAGTYRIFDGRGGGNTGNIRLAPLNSWPDNANLDKARRLLWPIKQKYGSKLSWADLIILAGNVALESMGLDNGVGNSGGGPASQRRPLWFGGGRVDAFAPEEDVFWGNEGEWLKDARHDGNELEKPLGAVQMGLIYVNPEGPNGNPDILASAQDIRETFSRMGMSDDETVALIAGGHTFGKAHGAADPSLHVGPEPEGAPVHQMGLGWKNSLKSGKGRHAITSGLEGAWTAHPTLWDHGYFENLFKFEWAQTKSPGGAVQWIPSKESVEKHGGMANVANVPDAHVSHSKHLPIMFTTDLALRYDPKFGPISRQYRDFPEQFEDAFKKAWYKLTHRDMGPLSRHLGPLVPSSQQIDSDPRLIWLDVVPDCDPRSLIHADHIASLKSAIRTSIQTSAVSVADLVKTAWASACTYRCTDHRGGANGGRVRLQPQIDWQVNDPPTLKKVLAELQRLRTHFHQQPNNNKRVSMADMIVLGGVTAIEEAIRRSSKSDKHVPFIPGRTDATQSQTDISSFQVLEPTMDGFRNYQPPQSNASMSPEEALLNRAHFLTLTPPEMVVLIGGMRMLRANTNSNDNIGILSKYPNEVLSNEYFVHLLDDTIQWTPLPTSENDGRELFQGTTIVTNHETNSKPTTSNDDVNHTWLASRVDLILGSNSQLRAISESYACQDSNEYFIQDFIQAWNKVMNLDRFDLTPHPPLDNEDAKDIRSKL